jgi:PAS domain S-box-containing protein
MLAMRAPAKRNAGMQGLQGGAPKSGLSLSRSIKTSLMIVVLGLIGLLTIMQWAARTVLKNVAIGHQQTISLQRRIDDLESRSKTPYPAAADASVTHPQTLQPDLKELALQNKEIQIALKKLQSDLESDLRAELASIGGVLRMQAVLGTVLLVCVISALFFNTRMSVEAGARRRGVEVLDQAHRDTTVLLNSIPSLLIGLDANGRIQQWNKAATKILGWEEAVVLGKTLDNCGVTWLTTDISSRIAGYVREPAAHSLDGIRLDKHGVVRSLGLKAIQLNTESSTGTLIVGADITKRMALEEQLRQAQKLESIGQLAAGIAHEINTPTQYIGDNVRFLKDSFGDLKLLLAQYGRLLAAAKGPALFSETVVEVSAAVDKADLGYLLKEIPKAIDETLEGVNRVATLVGAMKDFSHPGTKEKVDLDLNRAIDSTITVARNEWKYVADLETDYDPSLPKVSCLPGEFNQVILILIVNAAHAIADVIGESSSVKGKIKVQTRNCPEWDEVRIQDTGPGIPENIQARIFDPFFTTKEIGKGTGQGLAIARSVIVDKHGGTIHFETEQGKGTTFVIRLPRDGKSLSLQAAGRTAS